MCPPSSRDTGLWSFKAITVALKQALNWIYLLKIPKTSTPAFPLPLPSHVHPQAPVTTPLCSTFSQPPLGVKWAWFGQASPFSRWQLRLLSMDSLQAVWGGQIRPLSKDSHHMFKTEQRKKCLLYILPSVHHPVSLLLNHLGKQHFECLLFCLPLTRLVCIKGIFLYILTLFFL